ncbi:MAG: TIGR02466 family protein [Pseudomonadota bacterium]
MSQPQIQMRNLFATPVAVLQIPGFEAINQALEARIYAREAEVASVHHSNWGGWQSPDDFQTWCGDAGHAVLNTAQQLAKRFTVDRQGRPANPTWRMNAWANVNRAGQGNEFHTHPGAYWSATYYVKDGGAGADPSLGGEFEMADPRGVGPAMLAPELAFATQGGQSVGASELIRPVAGNLVLFPSWLSHGVRPYLGKEVRISIALNLTPT